MPNPFQDPLQGQFVHEIVLPVRYSETDQMGVVHHGVAALWMEEGRTSMMADAGYPYSEVESDGIFLPVVELTIRYLQPAKYGRSVRIQTWIERNTRTKIYFRNRIRDESTQDALIEGQVTLGCIEIDTRRPTRFNGKLQRLVDTGGAPPQNSPFEA